MKQPWGGYGRGGKGVRANFFGSPVLVVISTGYAIFGRMAYAPTITRIFPPVGAQGLRPNTCADN